MKRIEVVYRINGVIRTDIYKTRGAWSVGIVSDTGRGYVDTAEEAGVYRRIERVRIRKGGKK